MVQILSMKRRPRCHSEIPPTAVGGWFKSALFMLFQGDEQVLGEINE